MVRPLLIVASLLSIVVRAAPARAQSVNTIQTTDLSQAQSQEPQAKLIEMDLKRFKNATGHILLRPFPKRLRLEFEGSRLNRGSYVVARAASCGTGGLIPAARFKAGWQELHRFHFDQAHIATEKSLPQQTLANFQGRSIGLFQVMGSDYQTIDCKRVD